MESVESTCVRFTLSIMQHLKHIIRTSISKSNMSKLKPRLCLRQIVFVCCLVCSVSLVLFLNNRLSLNDYVLAVLTDFSRTELASEIQQLARRNLIQKECRDTTTEISSNAEAQQKTVAVPVRFKIENRHRVMYCDVPKVASTNLKRLLLILSGVVNKTDDLSTIPKTIAHERNPMPVFNASSWNDTFDNGMGDFTQLIFVRHPFERLVSAYRDKFANHNARYNKNNLGREIIRKFRKYPTRHSLENGHDARFHEFVDFIIDEWKKRQRPLDAHWRPFVDLCRPCAMRFDFIGKFETLNQDVGFLLRKLNASELAPLFTDQPKPKTTSSLWKEFIETITDEQLYSLHVIYADDFRLFGYPSYTGKEPLQ